MNNFWTSSCQLVTVYDLTTFRNKIQTLWNAYRVCCYFCNLCDIFICPNAIHGKLPKTHLTAHQAGLKGLGCIYSYLFWLFSPHFHLNKLAICHQDKPAIIQTLWMQMQSYFQTQPLHKRHGQTEALPGLSSATHTHSPQTLVVPSGLIRAPSLPHDRLS